MPVEVVTHTHPTQPGGATATAGAVQRYMRVATLLAARAHGFPGVTAVGRWALGWAPSLAMGRRWYAVARGRQVGIFTDWASTQASIHRFAGCVYRGFGTEAEARAFMAQHGVSPAPPPPSAAVPSAASAEADASPAPPPEVSWPSSAAPATVAATATPSAPRYILRFDGGSRGNPGPAGSGAVLLLEVDGASAGGSGGDGAARAVWTGHRYLGVATNNVAEYTALLLGLQAARALGLRALHRIEGDSSLVVNQVNGTWLVKEPHLQPLAAACRAWLKKAPAFTVKLTYIPRASNSMADGLANVAMDRKASGQSLALTPQEAVELGLDPHGLSVAGVLPVASSGHGGESGGGGEPGGAAPGGSGTHTTCASDGGSGSTSLSAFNPAGSTLPLTAVGTRRWQVEVPPSTTPTTITLVQSSSSLPPAASLLVGGLGKRDRSAYDGSGGSGAPRLAASPSISKRGRHEWAQEDPDVCLLEDSADEVDSATSLRPTTSAPSRAGAR